MKTISKMSQLIIAQPAHLTNRQIADKLGISIETVKDVRHYYGIKVPNPRKRGLTETIAAAYMQCKPSELAARLGCSVVHVNTIWRQIRNERID
jgi:DNA-binding CsgD family transcriptional regulator